MKCVEGIQSISMQVLAVVWQGVCVRVGVRVHEGARGTSWQSWPGSSGLWGIVFSSVRGEQFADSNKLPPAFISELTSSGESEPREKDSLTRTHMDTHVHVCHRQQSHCFTCLVFHVKLNSVPRSKHNRVQYQVTGSHDELYFTLLYPSDAVTSTGVFQFILFYNTRWLNEERGADTDTHFFHKRASGTYLIVSSISRSEL